MNEPLICAPSGFLENWVMRDWIDGIQLESVEDFTEIYVETDNSVYEIAVIDGPRREIMVRGGRLLPEKRRARLAGSSLGGGFLKCGGIYVGYNLEIVSCGTTIVTSTVQSIRVCSRTTQFSLRIESSERDCAG